MANDDRAAVQAGVDVKMMLTFRLAEALGFDDPVLDFDDLCERVRALAAPSPAVDREALIKIGASAITPAYGIATIKKSTLVVDALLARYDIRERGEAQAQPDGAALIAAERRRQVEVEGWTAEHDDDVGRHGKLARAAAVYATPLPDRDPDFVQQFWPWEQPSFYKPTPLDRVRELTKAGALIAAEIDRLQRAERGDQS